MWGVFRRLLRRDDFSPGERVVFVPDGTRATVNVSKGGWSHVCWDDEQSEGFGGSRIRNSDLRRDLG